MIKLAAFDVDGTLRDRDIVPPSAVEALRSLKEQGTILALCTGRSEVEVVSLREQLGIDWSITCNGAHIGYKGNTIFATPFQPETIKRWLQTAEQHGHSLLLYGASNFYMFGEDESYFRQAQKEMGYMEPIRIKIGEAVPDVYQCILFVEEKEEQRYTLDGKERYYMHRWRDWAVDLNPLGVNKAVGLAQVLKHLGITAKEAAAFGDGQNDLELLSLVGTGIAMGNGSEELKSKAKYVTKPMHEDGIAFGVTTWLLAK